MIRLELSFARNMNRVPGKSLPHGNFICPITQDVMSDPVVAKDGCSYERESITQWFKSNKRSPMTNEELSSTSLVSNHALRALIQEWKSRNLDVVLKSKSVLDDFKCDGWRLAVQKYPCDWTIAIAGLEKKYPVNLALLSTNSDFFSKVTDGIKDRSLLHYTAVHVVEGEVQIDSADFEIPSIGFISDTLKQLKFKVQETTGVGRLRQRYSFLPQRDPTSEPPLELREDWKRLSDYGIKRGDCLRLQVDPPWYQIDAASKSILLTLPQPCCDAFEECLDYLCDKDRTRLLSPSLAPGDALALMWLAGNLEVGSLQDELLRHLEHAMIPSSAHGFLGPALSLGLDKVAGAARALAARRLDAFPAKALCSLPLEEFEALIHLACGELGGPNSTTTPAWAPAWAAVSYLGQHYRSTGADGAAHRRLAALVVLSVDRACCGGDVSVLAWPATVNPVKSRPDLMDAFRAADSLQDAELEGAWASCAAANFKSVIWARPGLTGLPPRAILTLMDRADLVLDEAICARVDGRLHRIFEGTSPQEPTWVPRPEDAVFAAIQQYVASHKPSTESHAAGSAGAIDSDGGSAGQLEAGGQSVEVGLSAGVEEDLWACCRFGQCSLHVQGLLLERAECSARLLELYLTDLVYATMTPRGSDQPINDSDAVQSVLEKGARRVRDVSRTCK
jgi:hypothetical protein